MSFEEYIDLLREKYSSRFLFKGDTNQTFKGILKIQGSIIHLNKKSELNKAIIKYQRNTNEDCQRCKEIFKTFFSVMNSLIKYIKNHPNNTKIQCLENLCENPNSLTRSIINNEFNYLKKKMSKRKWDHKEPELPTNFMNRPMEFPGFISLDFNKKHVKDIMIIGEAAGPTISTSINFTYGLSNIDISNGGEMLTEKSFQKLKNQSNIEKALDKLKVNRTYLKNLNNLDKKIEIFSKNLRNNLWERISGILGIRLEKVIKNIYITDLVKCNAPGNRVWKYCRKDCFLTFLFKEMQLINPKVIFFLGISSYDYLKLYDKNNPISKITKTEQIFNFDEVCLTPNSDKRLIRKEIPKKFIKYNFKGKRYIKIYNEKCINQKLPTSFPTYGTISFKATKEKEKALNFIKIFHNTGIYSKNRWKIYSKSYKELIHQLSQDWNIEM